ncbi:MAPEG family protein [Methylopila sp. M107]|uniref:MAPEG family protein n=1 Tax=Methylopila sp. M107 TaxID=1101190 RepID=UPI000382EF3F|nr:MAPEG family protein [Methylopila sp. M107]
MTVQAILAPLFAQVLLTFVLLVWMARERLLAARSGAVKGSGGSVRKIDWPEKAQKVSDCFHNQLELPVLFYVVVTLALITRQADLLFVCLSWVFVVTRLAHAIEHTGSNRLKVRFGAFAAGFVVLFGLWFYFAFKLYLVHALPGV